MPGASLPRYLTQRKLGFYAVMEIPKPLRQALGKPRFLQSLQTQDRRKAEQRLPLVVARWKEEIARAKGDDSTTGLMWEIMEWRKAIQLEADPDAKEALEFAVGGWLANVERRKGEEEAQQAAKIIFNQSLLLKEHLEDWSSDIGHLTAKSQAMRKATVKELCDHFKTADAITDESVREYLQKQVLEKAWSVSTVTVRVSFMRSFIGYLDERKKTDLLKFFGAKAVPKTSNAAKTAKQRAWLPFDPKDVSALYAAALTKKKPDQALADLIAFGAYSGCRIEELCQLKVEDFTETSFRVTDSKTEAGIREVPLHACLAPLFARLKEQCGGSGFILEGSDEGSFGKRSDALGKRFGRLKTDLGFGERHVFHSVRKTVVSQLEQSGVTENVTADIVGHDKPRITYGLYSGGTSLQQKAKALAMIKYEGLLAKPQ